MAKYNVGTNPIFGGAMWTGENLADQDSGYSITRKFVLEHPHVNWTLSIFDQVKETIIEIRCRLEDMPAIVAFVYDTEHAFPMTFIGENHASKSYVVGMNCSRGELDVPGAYRYENGKLIKEYSKEEIEIETARRLGNTQPLPIFPYMAAGDDGFFDQRGTKIYHDPNRQPLLPIADGNQIYKVLSVGIHKQGACPLATIEKSGKTYCYRLPIELQEWVVSLVVMGNNGLRLLPAKVQFRLEKGRYTPHIMG